MSQTEITIPKPFDAHVHFRTGKMLRDVAQFTASVFPRAVVMGNLENDPVDNAERMVAYRNEILAAEPGFQPIMSVMLTRRMTVKTLHAAWKAGAKVLKFIPGGASTGGAKGLILRDLLDRTPLLAAARQRNMIFSCHFEKTHFNATGEKIPPERQEEYAIGSAARIMALLPGLKMVVEHATTKGMISFVKKTPDTVAATLTAHHAILTCEDVRDKSGKIVNGLNYCKPIAKSKSNRQAVRAAMVSGNPKFFFGSDSAPHLLERKQGKNPAAGVFTAPVALPLLCQIFEEEGALDKLEGFVSRHGRNFYSLSASMGIVTVRKEPWNAPFDYEGIPIFQGGKKMQWKVV